MHLTSILITTLASTGTLAQGCSLLPDSDPEYNSRYFMIPCWLDMDSACQPQLANVDAKLMVNTATNFVAMTPISESCVAEIAKEKLRKMNGERVYGWEEKHGTLNTSSEGSLIMTNVSTAIMPLYKRFLNEVKEFEFSKTRSKQRAVPFKA